MLADKKLDIKKDFPTWQADTPNNGKHVYFRWSDEIGNVFKNWTKISGVGIDIRVEGGLIVTPPTINHVVQKPYEWA